MSTLSSQDYLTIAWNMSLLSEASHTNPNALVVPSSKSPAAGLALGPNQIDLASANNPVVYAQDFVQAVNIYIAQYNANIPAAFDLPPIPPLTGAQQTLLEQNQRSLIEGGLHRVLPIKCLTVWPRALLYRHFWEAKRG